MKGSSSGMRILLEHNVLSFLRIGVPASAHTPKLTLFRRELPLPQMSYFLRSETYSRNKTSKVLVKEVDPVPLRVAKIVSVPSETPTTVQTEWGNVVRT